MLWYNPTLDQDMPRWVYASWSIGLFLYQTFDAVDGTQAYVSTNPTIYKSEALIEFLQAENASEWTAR